MKKLWLLYQDADFAVNGDFAVSMHAHGLPYGLDIEPVCLSQLTLGMSEAGLPFCLRNGRPAKPDGVLSRQRNPLVSRHFEQLGVPVYNNSRVCALCNDKRVTCQFLAGLPMPQTVFLQSGQPDPPAGTAFPAVIKPACSHGGDRVTLVCSQEQWLDATAVIFPSPAVQQRVVSGAGRDLRVYVVDGRIYAGVLRTAQNGGIVSNFKRGGRAELHPLTEEEASLAKQAIQRFENAGAHLWLAGVDLLYQDDRPVLGEVEDVVGSRMLYQVSELDIIDAFLCRLSARME